MTLPASAVDVRTAR